MRALQSLPLLFALPLTAAYADGFVAEPLPADSPLYDLPGAFVTPHLAGSQGNELARLGLTVVEEAERLLAGAEPAYAVDWAALAREA